MEQVQPQKSQMIGDLSQELRGPKDHQANSTQSRQPLQPQQKNANAGGVTLYIIIYLLKNQATGWNIDRTKTPPSKAQ